MRLICSNASPVIALLPNGNNFKVNELFNKRQHCFIINKALPAYNLANIIHRIIITIEVAISLFKTNQIVEDSPILLKGKLPKFLVNLLKFTSYNVYFTIRTQIQD